MAVINYHQFKEQSRIRIQETDGGAGKLTLLFTGVSVGLSLATVGLNLFLSEQISGTGGLSGLGARSVLQTIQTLLSYFNTLFSPFWQAGFLFAMISTARGQNPVPGHMTRGVQRFGSVAGYALWQMLITMGLGFVLMYAASFLFLLTPYGTEFLDLIYPMMEDGTLVLADGTINIEALPMDTMMPMMVPMLIIYGVMMIPAYVYVSYHLRMTSFLLLEGPRRSAFASMLVSAKMMKGHKMQMLKMDLSFWWYYLLEGLLTVVLWADVLLPALGITLPVDGNTAYFLALGVYGVLAIALHLWKKPYVDVAYMYAYDAIYQEFAAQHIR